MFTDELREQRAAREAAQPLGYSVPCSDLIELFVPRRRGRDARFRAHAL
ncbi:MAG TPA: hypothetical protein VH210_14905 [Gaiellaceae bacterium]|nr:hypothetical protein [Gaiellaceae bacterium]